MKHKFTLMNQTEDFVEWKCPTCSRHIKVSFGGGVEILNSGDLSAQHASVSSVSRLELSADIVEYGNQMH